MRESCAMRQRVTIYFDTFSSVIIHWYEMESEERQEVEGEEAEGERGGGRHNQTQIMNYD